jgi:hypothetical protein
MRVELFTLVHVEPLPEVIREWKAMADKVIRVPFEWDVGKVSPHPLVQEQIRKAGAYHSALWSSRCARYVAPILHLYWSLQPAFDVEKHPKTARMFSDRLQKQLLVNAIEVAPYVDVEHPVVLPASPTSLLDCLNRRPAWPVSIGVLMPCRGFAPVCRQQALDRWQFRDSGERRAAFSSRREHRV